MPHAPARAILAIETSNPTGPGPATGGAVALGEPDESAPAGFRPLALARLGSGSRHDESLLPAIDRACARAGVAPRAIGRVAVSVGPGGFSSVRVAVATAQMICEGVGALGVPVPTASALALTAPRAARRFAIALAGKRDTAWITVFDRAVASGAPDPAGALLAADALADLHARSPLEFLLADAHIPEAFHAWARSAGVAVRPPRFSALRVLAASLGRAAVDPARLLPLYPREPEAVALWRDRPAAR